MLFRSVANSSADLNMTVANVVQVAGGATATFDLASNTTLSNGITMTGTGAATIKINGTADMTRLTIAGMTLTDSLTIGDTAATFSTGLFSVSGTVTNGSTSAVTLTLSNQTSSAPNVLSANVSNGSGGALSLSKSGTSTWLVSGTNTYSGTTAVSAGTLQFSTPASLYNSQSSSWTSANITVANGATLAFNVGGTNDFTPTQIGTLYANLSSGSLASGALLGFDTSKIGRAHV